ncbi:dehydratase [Microbacterium sp. CH12i]|uniref:MaoC family dehydratase n=1 Tax=Microbacterium sp. CH12i TaxID=1479651 RepID=UPI000461FDE9|nr:MaoC family dehydratase [Microbacterium sp. CH12i]KDA05343.1 dehydratase [Microbacterium sp. CH12i]
MTTFTSLDELRAAVGSELGAAGPILVTQDRINGFADVTEDHQWIHIDAERAAAGPFGTTIAHGYLTLSFVAPFLESLLVVEGVKATLNYGLDSVRFPTPVPSGSEVSATAVLAEVADKPGGAEVRVKLTMTIPTSPKPVCVATVVMRIVE